MPEIGPEHWVDGPRAATNDLRAATPTHQRRACWGPRAVPMKEAGPWTEDRRNYETLTRIAVTIAIDWRFVTAIAILVVLVLLMK